MIAPHAFPASMELCGGVADGVLGVVVDACG